MVKSKESISLYNYPLFTRLSLDTPVNEPLELPSDACYLYFIDGTEQSLAKNEKLTATPGHVILSLCGLTAGRMISEQERGSLDSIIVHFNKETLDKVFEGSKPEIWQELDKPVTQYVIQSAARELVKLYFDSITQLFKNKEALTETILKLKFKEIVLLLLQTDNADNVRQIMKSLFSSRTFTFKELVDAHIPNYHAIEDLAVLTNCSVSTFKRKFKEVYKTTPGNYILNQKIDSVARLLKVSDDSISQIGYDCGFNSPEHLSRAFRKKYGVSPSEYRLNLSVK